MSVDEAGWLSPYLVICLVGFLPNEIFRIAGVVLGRGLNERSELFVWIRYLATALLAAVVAKLIMSPAPALAGIPLTIRFGAVAIGIAAYFATARSLFLAVLAGEAAFVAAAWAFGTT